jgi:carboxylate-amine ligase
MFPSDDRRQVVKQRVIKEARHSLLELVTDAWDTVGEAKEDLRRTIWELDQFLVDHGFGDVTFVATAINPMSRWQDQEITRDERTLRIAEEQGVAFDELITQGLHFHTGMTASAAVRVMTGMQRFQPLLLALSASGPYLGGWDTRKDTVRPRLFESYTATGFVPFEVETLDDYTARFEFYLQAKLIETRKDVHEHSRLTELGTWENRICDATQSLLEAGAIGALNQCLAVALAEGMFERGEIRVDLSHITMDILQENEKQAENRGLDAMYITGKPGERPILTPIRDLVGILVEDLQPVAERLGCVTELNDVRWILEHGNGATRQRAAVDASLRRGEQRLKTRNRDVLWVKSVLVDAVVQSHRALRMSDEELRRHGPPLLTGHARMGDVSELRVRRCAHHAPVGGVQRH